MLLAKRGLQYYKPWATVQRFHYGLSRTCLCLYCHSLHATALDFLKVQACAAKSPASSFLPAAEASETRPARPGRILRHPNQFTPPHSPTRMLRSPLKTWITVSETPRIPFQLSTP